MLSPQSSHQPRFLGTGISAFLFGLVLAAVIAAPSSAVAQANQTSLQLTSSVSLLKFGWVAVGSTETQLVILTNTGSSSVNLSSLAVNGEEFKVVGAGFPKTLAAGATTALNVTFTPTATGWVSGQVTVSSNASNPNLSFPIHGTGVRKDPVTASPAALSFGQVSVGTTADLNVVLTNHCLCTQILSAVQIAKGGFSLPGTTFPITLTRGQTVTLKVAFTPTASGPVGGNIMVDGPYVNIPLSGTGTATTAGGTLSVTPGSLNFGSVILGTTGTETSSLTASGGPVTVTSAASSSGQFSISGVSFPLTIPSGQSVSFGVVFTPTAAGNASANLSFSSSASATKTTEALTAKATSPYISLSWSPSTSQVSGYNIYRGTSTSGPFARLNSSLNTTTSYTDNSIGVGATYFYATTAVNSSGQESSYSNMAEVNVP
jgi:hypothetical protein